MGPLMFFLCKMLVSRHIYCLKVRCFVNVWYKWDLCNLRKKEAIFEYVLTHANAWFMCVYVCRIKRTHNMLQSFCYGIISYIKLSVDQLRDWLLCTQLCSPGGSLYVLNSDPWPLEPWKAEISQDSSSPYYGYELPAQSALMFIHLHSEGLDLISGRRVISWNDFYLNALYTAFCPSRATILV